MYEKVFKLHADLMKALANPKRLEIIHLLRDQEWHVNEMKDMLDLDQTNLSQHLMVLRDIQVVQSRKQGRKVYYKLKDKKFLQASDLIREILVDRLQQTGLKDEVAQKMSSLVPVTHDPVCNMRVSSKTAAEAVEVGGKIYYFCATGCKEKFVKNKHKYLKE